MGRVVYDDPSLPATRLDHAADGSPTNPVDRHTQKTPERPSARIAPLRPSSIDRMEVWAQRGAFTATTRRDGGPLRQPHVTYGA